MNRYTVLSLATLATLFYGCRNSYQGEVVKETYIHKYGVPVSATDWEIQGKDGKMIQLQKDGVTVTRSYEKGVLQGESTWTFPNTLTVQRSEQYEQGAMIAKKENYPNGIAMREECYDLTGAVTARMRWHEDGTPSAIENYKEGLLVSGEYRTPLNIVESRVQHGEGLRVLRNSEGELIAKDTIEGGQLTERVTYFSNGDPASVTPYVNDEIHGSRLTFLRGGIPQSIEQWSHGKQEGLTVVYQNGEKMAEIPYVDGKKHGVELRYRDGVVLVEEVTWLNDAQHGPHKIYVDGSIKTEWYHQGEIVSRPTFERLNPPRST